MDNAVIALFVSVFLIYFAYKLYSIESQDKRGSKVH